MAKVPVIDFSKQNLLQPGSPEWNSVRVQVRKALEDYGCFEASFDRVLELRRAVFRAVEELFDLPLQTKKLCVSENRFRGYQGTAPSRLLESMSISDAHVEDNIEERLTNILWPQGNISFSKTMVSFTELASRLEKTIKRMILESFGLEKHMDEVMNSANHNLRIMKYESPKTSEPTVGVRAHCDMSALTLLYQNEVDGLQIQNKDGEWINVLPSANSFVVMIGESFSVWLNGRLSSPYHRVTMKGNKARYSIGLFTGPRGGYQIEVPKELVDDKNPLLFKPYDHDEFLKFYSTQVAQGALSVGLKAYCSV
ncbi:hypothetical protein like AT1G52820 [Hibiscus trionum]|uniref:2-oxoglutarate-dependent dioxygenase DAO n=1 Tax=Hibiscus trionum TaxID=183268 RepID=A0A9W7J535_HIBTR|nr:hypothetical protein like AT1G52820 [Hibiscus trionum]